MNEFEMLDLGELSFFLSLEVQQKGNGIFLSQQKYASDILQQFNMTGCKTAETPMNVSEKLTNDDGLMAQGWQMQGNSQVLWDDEYISLTQGQIWHMLLVLYQASCIVQVSNTLELQRGFLDILMVHQLMEFGIHIWQEKFQLVGVGYSDSDQAGAEEA